MLFTSLDLHPICSDYDVQMFLEEALYIILVLLLDEFELLLKHRNIQDVSFIAILRSLATARGRSHSFDI